MRDDVEKEMISELNSRYDALQKLIEDPEIPDAEKQSLKDLRNDLDILFKKMLVKQLADAANVLTKATDGLKSSNKKLSVNVQKIKKLKDDIDKTTARLTDFVKIVALIAAF